MRRLIPRNENELRIFCFCLARRNSIRAHRPASGRLRLFRGFAGYAGTMVAQKIALGHARWAHMKFAAK